MSVHALVVADGDVPDRESLDATWPGWDEAVTLVIAADGGALRAERLGWRPDLVVGDGDSLGPDGLAALEVAGIPVQLVTTDKDESDAELALIAATARGAERITVVGAFGGERLDHALANVALLALPVLAGVRIALIDERTRVRLLDGPGRLSLAGSIGGIVSLLPYGADVAGARTEGLRYPLRNETLAAGPARGLSNVRERPDAAVEIRAGRLLVVESAGTLRR